MTERLKVPGVLAVGRGDTPPFEVDRREFESCQGRFRPFTKGLNVDDESELRLEVLHMAFDLLTTHGAFGVQDALNVADVLVYYVQTGNRPAKPEQPTIN